MGIRQNMDRLRINLRNSETAIVKLQSSCPHSESIVGFEHTSQNFVRVVVKCKACDKFLQYPTPSQESKFFNS